MVNSNFLSSQGFLFLIQQIKDNINLHQTRNLIYSLCRWNESLANQIVTVIFSTIQKLSNSPEVRNVDEMRKRTRSSRIILNILIHSFPDVSTILQNTDFLVRNERFVWFAMFHAVDTAASVGCS